MVESRQHTLDRIRRPRVQITYDVEVGGAIELKELPFVVGVLSDLSGMPLRPLPDLKDRKFIEIDRDNFQEVLSVISPRLSLKVTNKLTRHGSKDLVVDLTFNSMKDFEPQNLAMNIPQTAELYKKRTNLKNLIAKMDGNYGLEKLLIQILKNESNFKKLKSEIEQRDAKQRRQAREDVALELDLGKDIAAKKPLKKK